MGPLPGVQPGVHLVLLASFLAAAAAQSAEGNISTVTSCNACPGGVCGQTCRLVPVRAVLVTRNDSAARFWWFLFLLVIPVALLALCLYSCISTTSRRKSFQVQQTGVAMGPVATQPQAAYGYPVARQPATAVYVSPGPVYGAAPRPMGATPFLAAGGAGLLGGYMLGSALAD